jgi:hypothetical protein
VESAADGNFESSCEWVLHVMTSVGQVVVVVDGLPVLLRVQIVNDKTAEEQAMEAVTNHCHRGVLTDDTEIYIVAEKPGDGVGLRTVVPLEVTGAAARPAFVSASHAHSFHAHSFHAHSFHAHSFHAHSFHAHSFHAARTFISTFHTRWLHISFATMCIIVIPIYR